MGASAKDGVPDFDASGLSDEELAGAIMMLGYFEGALVRALQVASAENRRREAARGGDAAQEAPMNPTTAEPETAPMISRSLIARARSKTPEASKRSRQVRA